MKKKQIKTDAPLRAVIYRRVSTDDQAESKLGLEAQDEATKSMCAYKKWTIVGQFCDEGVSGRKESRPDFDKALSMLANKEADVLVVKSLDRISRSAIHFLKVMQTADAEGWDVAIRDLDLDTHSEAGRMVLTILAAVAEWEVEVIRRRTRDGLKAKIARGERVGRERVVGDDVVERIVKLKDAGTTFRSIASALDLDGVATPNGGRAWQYSTVRKIYDNAKKAMKI